MANGSFSVFPNERFVDLGLYQYGWEQCAPMYSYGPHVRNHFLFHYVLAGDGVLEVTRPAGGTDYFPVKAGEGFMIFPRQVTTYYTGEEHPWQYAWVEFDGLRVKETLDLAGISQLNPIYRPSARDLAAQLRQEMLYIGQSRDLTPLHLIGHLYLLLDLMTRSSSSRKTLQSGKMQDFYVREATSFIEQNFQNDISVEDIAAFCNLNRSYFGKIFRDAVGKSPQEFLIQYRMTKAAELLKLTELAVKDISNAVGYPNQLHFSRAFKSIYGISPRQWRAESRIIS